ncbi:MAG: hypothetical protein ACNS60_16585 [Candidatus Cyclobacteriaceae bacterium M2_1C_046]
MNVVDVLGFNTTNAYLGDIDGRRYLTPRLAISDITCKYFYFRRMGIKILAITVHSERAVCFDNLDIEKANLSSDKGKNH